MGRFNGRHHKGFMRVLRELKREEAEERNAQYQASLAETAQDSASFLASLISVSRSEAADPSDREAARSVIARIKTIAATAEGES